MANPMPVKYRKAILHTVDSVRFNGHPTEGDVICSCGTETNVEGFAIHRKAMGQPTRKGLTSLRVPKGQEAGSINPARPYRGGTARP